MPNSAPPTRPLCLLVSVLVLLGLAAPLAQGAPAVATPARAAVQAAAPCLTPAAIAAATKKKAAAAKKKAAAAAKKKAAEAKKKKKALADAKKKQAAARGARALRTRPVVKRPAAKRPVVKRPAAKRPVAKRPVAKRPVVKRPVAKRPVVKRPVVTQLPCAAVLPVVPGAAGPQPGPVAAAADAPLVPSTQPLGRTSATFFGVHGTPSASALNGFASLRLWDTGTTWADLQPAPDTWNWAPLDAAVQRAQNEGFSPLLVLGQTPAWASSDPSAPGVGRAGASMPPADLGRWTAYVAAVAARYRGRIAAYEMWNEPNFVGDYYHGSETTMARLTSLAHDAIKAADPAALVVTPGFATRTRGQLGWAFRYFDALERADYDVVSLHLYPMPNQLPEAAVSQLESVVDALRARGISKPVWNTEVNYGVTGGIADAVPVLDPLGGAFIARTLLADRAAGLDRVFWYSWGASRILGIGVTETDAGLSPAAQAWMRVAGWLTTSTLVGCSQVGEVHACSLRPDSGGWAQVLWSAAEGQTVTGSPGTTATVGLYGDVSPAAPGVSIAVGPVPVLVVGGGADPSALSAATPRG